ncbi:MAG: hypothetical protein K2O06_01280 [Acetatifactor sp.]|nr:hypothetical protein [Acetatifactor sp.]
MTAWKALGDEGLGRLKGLSTEAAKQKLVESYLDAERNDPDESALLGAMLATRYGDELHNHVREMLYFLSKPVMAQLYHCPENQVKQRILDEEFHVEANRCLRQGIRTAEVGREIDFREGFPRMEGLEFKKLFAMGR